MAEDQDPFAEFGGKSIAKKSTEQDPFAEFGGKTLKKKGLAESSNITTTPSANGSEDNTTYGTIPLEDVTINAKRVNPLVGNDLQSQIPVERQNELVQEVNKDPNKYLPEKEKGFGERLYNAAKSGVGQLGSIVSTIPSGVIDTYGRMNATNQGLLGGLGQIADYLKEIKVSDKDNLAYQYFAGVFNALPQGFKATRESLKQNMDASDFGKITEKYTGLPEEYNPLSPNNASANYFKEVQRKNHEKAQGSYKGGIWQAIKDGKYAEAGKLTATGAVESLPLMLGLAASRGAGLSGNATLAALGVGTAESEYEQLKAQNPEIDKNLLLMNAQLTGLGEAGSELLGFNMLYDQGKKLFLKGAKEQAENLIKTGLKSYLNTAFKKSFVGSATLSDAAGEMGNQLWKNAIDKWSGVDPERDYTDGVMDAGIISLAATGGVSAGVQGMSKIINPKVKTAIAEDTQKLEQLNSEIENPNLPEEAKNVLRDEVANTTEKINDNIEKEAKKYDSFSQEDKAKANSLNTSIENLKVSMNDENTSPQAKEVFQKRIDEQEAELAKIKPEENKKDNIFKEYDAELEYEGMRPMSDAKLEQMRDDFAKEYGVPTYEEIYDRVKKESDSGKGFFAKLTGSQKEIREATEKEFKDNILKAVDAVKPTEQPTTSNETETPLETTKTTSNEANEQPIPTVENVQEVSTPETKETVAKTGEESVKDIDEINKRRNAELENEVVSLKPLSIEEAFNKDKYDSDLEKYNNREKIANDINAKYDKEIADLKRVGKPKFTIKGETVTPKENVSDNKQPTVEGEAKADAEVIQPATDDRGGNEPKAERVGTADEKVKTLDRLAHQNIESEDLNNTASNQSREKGREFTDEERQYNVQKKMDALRHGDDIVVEAKNAFGDDYVGGLLKYIDDNGKTLTADKKQLMYVTLENDLNRQLLVDPDNLTLKKQEKLLADKSRAFGRETGRAVAMGQLRQLARVGYDSTQVNEDFFSPKERAERSKVEKAVNATSEDVQKEYETQQAEREANTVDIELERLISEGVEKQIKDIYDKLPSKRKERADKAINALEKIQKKLRANTYDAGIGLPIAILDTSITIIKNSIRAGVKVADAIELGINYIKEKQGKWYKEDKFRKDMLAGFESENIDLKEGKSIMSPEQRRKIYITQLNKDIADLDAQIEAGEKKAVNKEDKYANDEEITKLREERDGKRDELNEIDPRQREASKLKQDLDKAQKSLNEYERRINEDDFTPAERNQQNVDAKLKDLREKRDKIREEYQSKKKAYEESLKYPIAPPTKEELEAKEVQRKVDANNKAISDLQDRLAKNDLSTNTKNQSLWTADLGKLEATRNKLQKELSDRRSAQAKANKPVKTVDEEINAKIEADIKASKKSIEELEEKLANNDLEVKRKKSSVWSEELGKLKQEQYELSKKIKDARESENNLVNNALIDAGYSREITVKKDGKSEKKSILDWRKLTGEEGSLDNINKVIDQTLGKKGYTSSEIEQIKQSLKDEYNDLHASIIEKSINELERRNTPRENNSKILARRLAELYNYGLFEKESDTYDRLINQTLGVSIKNQQLFEEIKALHKSLADLVGSRDANGYKLSDVALSTAEAKIKNDIKKVIQKVAFSDGNGAYKATVIVKNLINGMQRQLLNTVGQLVENPISAKYNDLQVQIQDAFKKREWDSPALKAHRKMLSTQTYKSILSGKGEEYGGVGSPFTTKNAFDDAIRSVSPSKMYQAYVSAVTGTAFLDSSDSAFKIKRTELEFTHNLIRVLTDKSNPNGAMSQQEALNYVSEKLTGQSFEDAKKTAKEIIESVNGKAGKQILSTNESNVVRMANDIVKDALVKGEKITKDLVEDSFKAAYTTAGTGLGHESNNIITKGLGALNRSVETELNDAIKRKEFGRAAMLNMTSILTKNILNPFAGGGANWTILGLQKMGIPTQIVGSDFWTNKKLDLSSVEGLRDAQRSLTAKANIQRANGRTLIAGTTGLIIAAAAWGSGEDEEIRKWRKKHPVLDKYLYKVIPPALSLLTNPDKSAKGRVKAIASIIGDRTGGYGDKERLYAIGKDLANNKNKSASGRTGDIVGNRFNVPYSPIGSSQMAYQIRDLHREFMGLPPIKSKFKNKDGFVKGFFKRGWFDFLGGNEKAKDKKEN